MADGHGVAAAVGWAGLSLKYVDRTSFPRLMPAFLSSYGRLSVLLLFFFGFLPAVSSAVAHAMATLYHGRGARNCLWIRPLSLDFSSPSFYLRWIFNSRHEFSIFMPARVLRNEEASSRGLMTTRLNRNSRSFSALREIVIFLRLQICQET